MQIQVIGSGCQKCKNLFDLTQKAVLELMLNIDIEYIPDVAKLLQLGIMSSPAIVVDNKPILIGFTDNIERIKEMIAAQVINESSAEKKCNRECKSEGCC